MKFRVGDLLIERHKNNGQSISGIITKIEDDIITIKWTGIAELGEFSHRHVLSWFEEPESSFWTMEHYPVKEKHD
jgi:hypothetical protein